MVIESFGKFLIGGNFAVGIFVFLILMIINLVVVTKGPAAFRKSPRASRWTRCQANRWRSTPISPRD